MTTCRDIITYAMRQTKVLASGEDPTGDEMADGMVALQSFYDGLVADGMFTRLNQRYETTDYEPLEGDMVTAPSGVTIDFPETLDDGTRTPRDLSLIETVIDGTRTLRVWDRTGWVSLLELDATTAAPLASRGAFGLAAALATSGGFAAMFGNAADIGPDTRRLALQFMRSLSFKYGTDRATASAEYF